MRKDVANTRQEVLNRIALRIVGDRLGRPIRVAIDGPDASGKTSLADELVAPIRDLGLPVIRASIDGFHRPSAARYARGWDSPVGYYLDSFDHDAMIRVLLKPLGPGGSRLYQTSAFDYRTDRAVVNERQTAAVDAVLLFDGVFLLRPELRSFWDVTIFLDVPFADTLRRAVDRDVPRLGSSAEVEHRYRVRYIPGQQLYFDRAKPRETADVVLQNGDVCSPGLAIRQL